MIHRVKVTSSNIKEITYDTDDKSMIITFNNNIQYKYFNVENSIFEEFIDAESVGRYFLTEIKGKYESQKI